MLSRAVLLLLLGATACFRGPSLVVSDDDRQPGEAGGAGGAADALGGAGGEGPDPIVEPGELGSAHVLFEIDTTADVKPISPLIYGLNGKPSADDSGFTLFRAGGNRWSAFNWENGASNAGKDYFFQNDGLLTESEVPGHAVRPLLESTRLAQTAAIVTIPIGDYVSADKFGKGDVRETPNYLETRFKQNHAFKKKKPSPDPDSTDGHVYQEEFVRWVKRDYGDLNVMFSLDNEPDLWSSTHAEIHPQKVSYTELTERSIEYARAVKSVWPEAKVLGFVSFGWTGYVSLQGAPDSWQYGNFINYFLTQMKAAEDEYGQRLIDYLDLHWYPEASGGRTRIIGQDIFPEVAEARVQAPRSLWDLSYAEDSWIADDYTDGPIVLLRRVQRQIATYYPGTELAFTEWNYGGGYHISGGLSTADVLGVFGREGVALATNWSLSGNEAFIHLAYRLFRNYDGLGSHFGDQSVRAAASNDAYTSVYASTDSLDPGKVTIVALNKSAQDLVVGIRVRHRGVLGALTAYQFGASAATIAAVDPVPLVAQNAYGVVLPAQTATILVAHSE